MSCRKFRVPRHGSLQFRPKKRSSTIRPRIKAFPKDDPADPVHLTAFMGYKAGMLSVLRAVENKGKNKAQTKDVYEAVSIVETPSMIIYGVVGYRRAPGKLEPTKVILAKHLSEGVIRRIFSRKHVPGMQYSDLRKCIGFSQEDVEELRKTSDVIRVLAHTQVHLIKQLDQKKAHVMEIQINGGTIAEKVEFAMANIEKEIPVTDFLEKNELFDSIGVTKGKGFSGVTKRWHTRILPRKSNKGIRKVACIGAWHPSRVMYSVARAGQLGYHRRTMINHVCYGIGNGKEPFQTDFDLTVKTINPLGGFPNYGYVNNDFIMLGGAITGPAKRVIVLRKSLLNKKKVDNEIVVKFVDTSSRLGRGRFQTAEEKREFFGITKSEIVGEY